MSLKERIARRLYPTIFQRAETYKRLYRHAWEDHLSRCDHHDSWDQCPCVEEGHKGYRITARGNPCECCKWCEPAPDVRDKSPFELLRESRSVKETP